MAGKALSGALICSAALLMAGQAMAQARDNYFARDRNVSVRERARPGYQALGLPLSSFILYPKVELGVQENSNIYGAPNHPTNDVIGVASPEVDLVSQWARNKLTVFARTSTHEYASHSGEDTTDWQFGGTGRLDLGDSTANFGGDYGYLAEPRTASVGQTNLATFTTIHPVEYYQSDANADLVHTFNRLQVQGGLTYLGQQFQNATNTLGQTVLENAFDNQRLALSAKAGYAMSPDTALYAAIGYNTIDYPNASLTLSPAGVSRNSSGETYDVGANFDLTQLLRGDVEVGYLHQEFSSGVYKPLDGFHALGKVEWFPTQLTTVTMTGARNVNPATVPGSPAVITAGVSGQVDHELLRNVILTGIARYEDDDYQGIDRRDHISEFTISGDYLLNHNIGLHLAYDYLTQDSAGVSRGLDFNDNRVTLSTTLQY